MTRVLLFILGILAAALGLAWLADRPGTVRIEWLGYQIETSAFVAAVGIIALVVAGVLLWSLFRFIVTRPAAVAARRRERRKEQGFHALTGGLLAIGVGDRALAQRYAGIARRNLPQEPLTALLKAQTAQLRSDKDAARRAFQDMLERPETELLGLRGLFLEAKRSSNDQAARSLAEQAVKRDPKLAWGVNALFEMQARAGDWSGALDTLAIARQNGHVDSDLAVRRRAVLLTAAAREEEASDPDKAITHAHEALRLAPSLVPAAEIAGRILSARGETRQAARLISRTWKLAPHPDLALVYAFVKPGEAPRERLKRVKTLASLTPDEPESAIAVAGAAIEAHDWQEARKVLAPYVEDRPSARVCALMARIEAGEGDKGREREWLARAVRAPRDRAWIADGYISDRWLPISPVTGAVDAFQWKAPVDLIGRGDERLLIEEQVEPAAEPQAFAREELRQEIEPEVKAEPVEIIEIAPPEPKPVQSSQSKLATEAEIVPPPTRTKPAIFVPERPPDDPGVEQGEADESPTSLERLRAAQIR